MIWYGELEQHFECEDAEADLHFFRYWVADCTENVVKYSAAVLLLISEVFTLKVHLHVALAVKTALNDKPDPLKK